MAARDPPAGELQWQTVISVHQRLKSETGREAEAQQLIAPRGRFQTWDPQISQNSPMFGHKKP
jgi:hypothetical protein